MKISFNENGFVFVPDASLGHRDNVTIAPENARFGFKNQAAITELQARLVAGKTVNIHVDQGFKMANAVVLAWLFEPVLKVCDTFDEVEQRVVVTYDGATRIQPKFEEALQAALDFNLRWRKQAVAA